MKQSLCSKLKNGLCKTVTKSRVVTKFNVTKLRFHCTLELYTKLSSVNCTLFENLEKVLEHPWCNPV